MGNLCGLVCRTMSFEIGNRAFRLKWMSWLMDMLPANPKLRKLALAFRSGAAVIPQHSNLWRSKLWTFALVRLFSPQRQRELPQWIINR